jgi:hypothetical protein
MNTGKSTFEQWRSRFYESPPGKLATATPTLNS